MNSTKLLEAFAAVEAVAGLEAIVVAFSVVPLT